MNKNTSLETILAEMLQAAQTATGKAIDFTIQQAPDVIQQYVLWAQIKAGFWILVCFTATLICIGAMLRYWRKLYIDAKIATTVTAGFLTLLTFITISDSLMVFIAPKAWLLKEALNLVR